MLQLRDTSGPRLVFSPFSIAHQPTPRPASPFPPRRFQDSALEARRALLSPEERRRLGIFTEAELSAPVELPYVEELVEAGIDLATQFERVELVTMDYFVRRLKDGKLDFREVYAFEKGVDPDGLTPEWWCAPCLAVPCAVRSPMRPRLRTHCVRQRHAFKRCL